MQNSMLRTALAVALFASPLVAMADSASVSQNGAFISVMAGKSHFDIDHGPAGAANDTRQDRNDTGFGVLGHRVGGG